MFEYTKKSPCKGDFILLGDYVIEQCRLAEQSRCFQVYFSIGHPSAVQVMGRWMSRAAPL